MSYKWTCPTLSLYFFLLPTLSGLGLGSFLQWAVVKETGLNTIDHYLDDFFFAGSSSSSDCQLLMDGFISLAK